MELMALSTKVCSKCGRELPDSEFYPHRRANRIKSDATVEELEKIISYMKDNDGE